MRARVILSFCLLYAVACQPEREYSGLWQQKGGDSAGDGYVYELHLGRYGDSLSGMVVRYLDQGEGYSYERTSECGCFLIEAGRVHENHLRFQLHRPDLPGPTEAKSENPACSPIPTDLCQERIFVLNGDDEELTGQILCNSDDPQPLRVTFHSVFGRTRTVCIQEEE